MRTASALAVGFLLSATIAAGMMGTAQAAEAAEAITVTPSSGPAGTPVVISGSGWEAGLPLHVVWNCGWSTTDRRAVADVTTSPDGDWSVPAVVPGDCVTQETQVFAEAYGGPHGSPEGVFTLSPQSPESPATTPLPCESEPRIYWSQTAGPQGTHFTLDGSGWAGGGTVTIALPYGSAGLFGASTLNPAVDSLGNWRVEMYDQHSPPGDYEISFEEELCGLQVGGTFRVTVTEEQLRELLSGIWDVVSVGNTACDVTDCNTRWSSSGASKAITYLERARTIYSLANATALAVRVGKDLDELNAALEAADEDKHDPKVVAAARKTLADTKDLHRSLLDTIPGLGLLWPVPE
ncbi:hypothetical protein ACIA5D_44460 [Actinoplanes sp. NPDC051513]|uniref:hypothetical protein n=1 Tax=Actinoplanes sp. NPDC051513 TaxID=3363908 RepID=UPI00379A64B5